MLADAILALNQGLLIAYPTEAVFGLGCDPDDKQAVEKLLQLKRRPVAKGLILVAANITQLQPYVDMAQLDEHQLARVKASWPGPNTWVIPKQIGVPNWLSGEFDTLAVRVSAHPLVQRLCADFGKPLVSTSANLSGAPPCRSAIEVRQQLGDALAAIIEGECGKEKKPTQIRNALSNQVVRPG